MQPPSGFIVVPISAYFFCTFYAAFINTRVFAFYFIKNILCCTCPLPNTANREVAFFRPAYYPLLPVYLHPTILRPCLELGQSSASRSQRGRFENPFLNLPPWLPSSVVGPRALCGALAGQLPRPIAHRLHSRQLPRAPALTRPITTECHKRIR